MKLVRRLASTHRIVGIAGLSLAALTLGISVASWADESAPAAGEPSAVALSAAPTTEATVKPPAPDADSPKPSHHRPVKRLTAAQRIDENVRRLTRGLELDPGQQEKLRAILVDQHRRILDLRSGNAAAREGLRSLRPSGIRAEPVERLRWRLPGMEIPHPPYPALLSLQCKGGRNTATCPLSNLLLHKAKIVFRVLIPIFHRNSIAL